MEAPHQSAVRARARAYELTHHGASRCVNREINESVTGGGIYGDFIGGKTRGLKAKHQT